MSIMSSIKSAGAWLNKLEEALEYDIHAYQSDRMARLQQELQQLKHQVENSPHPASQSSASNPFPADQTARSVQ
jgi:hypothetical protein